MEDPATPLSKPNLCSQCRPDAKRCLHEAAGDALFILLAFLCEHTDLAPMEVIRELHARAGMPWQSEMRLLDIEAECKRWAA